MQSVSSPESDADLLGRLAEDPADAAAFEELYRLHVGPLTRFLAARCASPEDVADAVAQTFLSVLTSAASYDARRGNR